MIKRGSKRGYEFGFAWIFTMFVGAAFITLAIYSATQLIKSRQLQTNSEQAKQIGILLTPLETGLNEGEFGIITVQDTTKIFNTCRTPAPSNPFGSQNVAVSLASVVGDKNVPAGEFSTFHNKYFFTQPISEGDDFFYVLSKPFSFPFKVTDLTMIWSDKETYCFDTQSVPPEVRRELEDLNMTNIFLTPLSSCPVSSVKVCSGRSCDIQLDTNSHTVTKNGNSLTYFDSFGQDKYSMMYAAVFSEPELYKCEVRRVMARAAQLSYAYHGKATTFAAQPVPCASTIISPLATYHDTLLDFADSGEGDPNQIFSLATELNDKNPSSCNLW